MVRLRVPNGHLMSHQLRVVADFAEKSARGVADITVRENFQLHWMPIEVLPDLFENLWRVRTHDHGHLRRRHPQHHGVSDVRRGRRRADRRRAARPGRQPDAERQPRLLQRAAQVQDHDHRLPGLVLLSRDQRRRAHRGAPPGDGRGRIRRAGRRRTLHEPAPGRSARRVRAAEPGPVRRARDRRDLPRRRAAAPRSREGAPEVPLPPARLDRRALPGRAGAPHRSRPAPGRRRRSAGRSLPRSRRHPSAEAGRVRLRGRPRAAGPAHGRADARGRGSRRALRQRRAAHHDHAEPGHPERPRASAPTRSRASWPARGSGSTPRRSGAAPSPARGRSSASSRSRRRRASRAGSWRSWRRVCPASIGI